VLPEIGFMENLSGVIRPRLLRQIRVTDEESAQKRKVIGNHNISRFFVELYRTLYGGKTIKDPWGNGLSHRVNDYSFSPDIVVRENGNAFYTEVKVTSNKTSQIHCRAKQISNNLYKIVSDATLGDLSSRIEYAFFKYGGSEKLRRGLNFLSNQGLVESLSDSKKELAIMPMNLFLYLSYFSYVNEMNQSTSRFGVDQAIYLNMRGGTITDLMSRDIFDEEGNIRSYPKNNPHSAPDILKNFRLNDLIVERTSTHPMVSSYHGEYKIKPFPVVRWSIPEDKYGKFIGYILKHHYDICLSLGLEDLLENSKHDPVPF